MPLTFDQALEKIAPHLGKFVYGNFAEDPVPCYLFDYRKVDQGVWSMFLEDTFCDGFIDGYLGEGQDGTSWIHETHLPFALAGVDGPSDEPFECQFNVILLFDLGNASDDDCPILSVEVDGTAMPDEEPGPILMSIQELSLTTD